MSERSFDDFDSFANDYRDIHSDNVKMSGVNSFYFAEHKVKELAKFESNESLRMLDVGCGDAVTEFFIEQYFSKWKIDGIDVSEKSIAAAKDKKLPNSNFTVYDGIQIPFGNDQFDVIFIAAVLHHVDFSLHDQLMAEVSRVLKPGGRLYIFEHNPINPATHYLVKACVFDKDAKLLSYHYAEKLLKRNGFRNLSKKFLLFFPRKYFFKKLLWLEPKLSWLPLGGQYMFRAVK